MSGWGGDALRWGTAGAVILAAHIGGGVWGSAALQRSAQMQLPAPISVDLLPEEPPAPAPAPDEDPAPEAEAEPADPAPEPPPEEETAEAPAEDAPAEEPVPDFEVPPLTPLPPVTEFAELLPDSALLLASSDRPKTRPVRREPEPEPQVTRREERREPPKEQARQEPRRERAPAKAEATQRTQRSAPAQGTARQQQGSAQGQPREGAGASKQQMDSWSKRIGSRVASHMQRTRIPGGGRGSVTINVSVSIAANGAASARLASSTGNAQVDAALVRQAGRMPRMPAPPNGKGASFVLPIRIDL